MKVINWGPVGFNGEWGHTHTHIATLIKWAAEQWVVLHSSHFWVLFATGQTGFAWWIEGIQEAILISPKIIHPASCMPSCLTICVRGWRRKRKRRLTRLWLSSVLFGFERGESKCKAECIRWLGTIYWCEWWHVFLVETDSCVCHTVPAEAGGCHSVSVVMLLTVVVSF